MLAFLRKSRGLAATAIALASALVLAGAFALLQPSYAFAADKGKIALEPVTFDGSTYKGTDPKGPFSTLFPKGLGKNDPNSATTELDDTVKQNTDYPWGSVGAKNGSFIQNNTGKPICKFVATITDTATFETAPAAGGGWTAEVSKDKKTITFTAKDAASCIKNGGWFWMQVPKSPQPGSGETPTLKGSLAALTPDPNGETAVVALTTDDAFISTLYDIDEAIAAEGTPSPSDTAVAPTDPSDSPSGTPSDAASDSPTGAPSTAPTSPSPTIAVSTESPGAGW